MDVSTLAAALDELVLERLDDGRFVCCSPAPRWCFALWPEPPCVGRSFAIEEFFEFMTAFVPDAEAAWDGPPGARVDSEFWTEVGIGGEPIHLEAIAVRVGRALALVIRRNERLYGQHLLVLQRAREQRLAHDALTREIETKDVLMHAVVHDLAAPLHSVLGILSLLAENGASGVESAQLVKLALDAAMRQRELIGEILDVFSAEHGGLDAGVESGARAPDAAAVIAQAVTERELVARRRGVEIALRGGAPARVIAEPTRLFRVVTNLLDNAIRYSPEGTAVEITLARDGGAVVITVDDEGPGIPPELVPQLFEKLPRGRDRRGTGLGLYFCRITVEGWGGGVGYEPRGRRGSRFWVRLRAAADMEVRGGEAALAR